MNALATPELLDRAAEAGLSATVGPAELSEQCRMTRCAEAARSLGVAGSPLVTSAPVLEIVTGDEQKLPEAPPSDSRQQEAERREELVLMYLDLQGQKYSKNEAVREIRDHLNPDVSRATLDRYAKMYAQGGLKALLPNSHLAGRPSTITRLRKQLGEQGVTDLINAVRGLVSDTVSITTAARMHARTAEAPQVFAELVDYTEKGTKRRSKQYLPKTLRNVLKVNDALMRKHEGQRASDLRGFWIPRKLDILPGDVWSSDDTTPIYGWWVPWEHALNNPDFDKASCEYRFGVKLLQGQFLPLMDVASNYVFDAALIAREKASYRASDIWALFGRAFDMVGLPRLGLQLERGTWEAHVIQGQKVEVEDADGYTSERRVGGLRMLPTNVTDWHRDTLGAGFAFPSTLQTFTSFLPKSKPVEALFDRLQTLEGTLWGNLGRDQMRRPRERAKKIYQACRRGAEDPRLHFLSGAELMKRLTEYITFLNREPMEGRVFRGVPEQLWADGLRKHPLLHLPESQRYLFRRSMHVGYVTRGWAEVRYTDLQGDKRLESYCNPEHFPMLEGRKVAIYYDAYAPQEPAHIHDAANDAFLCTADWHQPPGMFLDAGQTSHDVRKRYNAALTVHYAQIAKHAPSRQMPAEIAARRSADAQARAAQHESQAAPASVTVTPTREPRRSPSIFASKSPAENQAQADADARLLEADRRRRQGG